MIKFRITIYIIGCIIFCFSPHLQSQGFYVENKENALVTSAGVLLGGYSTEPGFDAGYTYLGKFDFNFSYSITYEPQLPRDMKIKYLRPSLGYHFLKEPEWMPFSIHGGFFLKKGFYSTNGHKNLYAHASRMEVGGIVTIYGRFLEDRSWYIVPLVEFRFSSLEKKVDFPDQHFLFKSNPVKKIYALNFVFKTTKDFNLGIQTGILFETDTFAIFKLLLIFPTASW